MIVVGGGCAGVGAAIAAARNGARTLLVEQGAFLGGDLVSGLPVLGCCNSLGDRIVGGVASELLDACRGMDGYVGCIFDCRTLWGECFSPDVMRLAIADALERGRVSVLLSTFAVGVAAEAGAVTDVALCNKSGRTSVAARMIVDCSGDADVAFAAGAKTEKGNGGRFQPVSLVFQMAGVDFGALLEFVRDHPDEVIVAENPIIGKSSAECAAEIHKSGYPYLALSATGPLLSASIASGEIDPCAAVFMWPTSMKRREVGLNSTRIADIDATDVAALSAAAGPLMKQTAKAAAFLRRRAPGFAEAELSRIAPRTGVRETRRVIGEYVLQTEDVLEGRTSRDVIAKGGHHVDIHGAGTYQKRIPVKGGRSYDIPYGCLIPKGVRNVLVAGRCISSTREANGSARVMGTCLATGEAAGTAAALCVEQGRIDARGLPVGDLQSRLKAQGAILDGTR